MHPAGAGAAPSVGNAGDTPESDSTISPHWALTVVMIALAARTNDTSMLLSNWSNE